MWVDCIPSTSQSVTASNCTFNILTLRLFIQGFYLGSEVLQPVEYNNGLTADPTICDSVTVELHQPTNPYSLVLSVNANLKKNGEALASIPNILPAGNYYIVVKHRNSIEVWSKNPVAFGSAAVNYDFSQ